MEKFRRGCLVIYKYPDKNAALRNLYWKRDSVHSQLKEGAEYEVLGSHDNFTYIGTDKNLTENIVSIQLTPTTTVWVSEACLVNADVLNLPDWF